MKLRIKGNSIRLRLGRSEVVALAESGLVEESTHFDPLGQTRLVYRLVASPQATAITASFESNTLTVEIPGDQARSWALGGEIGLEARQALEPGESLRILIEKDLECIDAPPDESQADAFPRASHGSACTTLNQEATSTLALGPLREGRS